NVRTGREAKSNDPSTWATFDEALAYHRLHPKSTDGIGYVFSTDDPYCGVDLDKCRNPEADAIEPWALAHIARLDTHTEISPSDTGVKLIVRGAKPSERCSRGKVEMYDRERYFALTGHRLPGTPAEIGDRGEALAEVYRQVFEPKKPDPEANPTPRFVVTPGN